MFDLTLGWFGLLGLLVLAPKTLAIVASIWLAQQLGNGGGRGQDDVLARRCAAGEIDREAHLRMRDELAVR